MAIAPLKVFELHRLPKMKESSHFVMNNRLFSVIRYKKGDRVTPQSPSRNYQIVLEVKQVPAARPFE